jgi:hypothetical protein
MYHTARCALLGFLKDSHVTEAGSYYCGKKNYYRTWLKETDVIRYATVSIHLITFIPEYYIFIKGEYLIIFMKIQYLDFMKVTYVDF